MKHILCYTVFAWRLGAETVLCYTRSHGLVPEASGWGKSSRTQTTLSDLRLRYSRKCARSLSSVFVRRFRVETVLCYIRSHGLVPEASGWGESSRAQTTLSDLRLRYFRKCARRLSSVFVRRFRTERVHQVSRVGP